MFTPYDKEHYDFLDSLMFELYDEQTRNLIYDFYENHDVNVYLPRQLVTANGMTNWLKYFLEFKGSLTSYDRYMVYFKDGKYDIWEID